jgi:hypothetical protein
MRYFANRDVAKSFLEELANRSPGQASVSSISAARQWIFPDGVTQADKEATVTTVLTESGIATVENGQARFASPALYDFLRASHVARRIGGLWGRRVRLPRALPVRTVRNEQDEQFMRFLIFLSWPKRQQEVVKQLDRFLQEPDPNIHFVAELCRRVDLPGCDLRERTTTILRDEIGTALRLEQPWREMVESLHSLDPQVAITALDDVVRSPGPKMDGIRRFRAVEEMSKRNPVRGAENLVYVAEHPLHSSEDQIAVALLIQGINHPLGVLTLDRLSRDPSLGDARAEAGLHLDSPPRWCSLIAEPTLSDKARWPVLKRIRDRVPDRFIEMVQVFADTADQETTRLQLAELVHDRDSSLARRLADDVAWTTKREAGSNIRLEAVLLLGKFDPKQAQPLLERFAETSARSDETRLRAAVFVLEKYRSPNALAKVAHAKDVALPYHEQAAEKLSGRHHELSAKAYIAISAEYACPDPGRLAKLTKAFSLASRLTEEHLVRLAKDDDWPDKIRVDAVRVATTLSRERQNKLFTEIASTAQDDNTAIALGKYLLSKDKRAGQQLMAEIALRPMPFERRLEAAELAGKVGKPVLIAFTSSEYTPRERLAAARVLRRVDASAAMRALIKLARTSRIDEVRMQAILLLRPQDVMPCLLAMVTDRTELEDVRMAACDQIVNQDPEEGRRLLLELTQTTRLPHRVLDHIRWLLRG